jgi:hypothetical protein
MMAPNSSVVVRRPLVLMVSWNCWSGVTGAAPMRPSAAWMFWFESCVMMSPGVRLSAVSLSGSSQTRSE